MTVARREDDGIWRYAFAVFAGTELVEEEGRRPGGEGATYLRPR